MLSIFSLKRGDVFVVPTESPDESKDFWMVLNVDTESGSVDAFNHNTKAQRKFSEEEFDNFHCENDIGNGINLDPIVGYNVTIFTDVGKVSGVVLWVEYNPLTVEGLEVDSIRLPSRICIDGYSMPFSEVHGIKVVRG